MLTAMSAPDEDFETPILPGDAPSDYERYLNIAYFGDGAHGIQAASRHYFSKPASRLKLHEAALLAGLVKNPTRFDPTNDKQEAINRRNTVIARMLEKFELPDLTEAHAVDYISHF